MPFFPLFILGKNRKYRDVVTQGRLLPAPREAFQMSLTFLLAVIGWIIFRAESIWQAADYIVCMVTKFHFFCMPVYGKKAVLYIFVLLIVEWLQREKQFALQLSPQGIFHYRSVRWGTYCLLIITTLLLAGRQEEFIYFQF